MHYEPNRYHKLPFGLLYKYITGSEYEVSLRERKAAIDLAILQSQQMLLDQQVKVSTESVFALAHELNKRSEDESGIYTDKHSESEEEVIIQKEQKKRKPRKGKNKEMTFVQKTSPREEDGNLVTKTRFDDKSEGLTTDNRPYKKIKHIFEIKVKELKNIPILERLIKDVNSTQTAASVSPNRMAA